MDGAKPPPADAAVGRCGRIAGLSHRRNRLTGPLEAPGISLVRLLQHIPSSCGLYTPSIRGGVPVGSYRGLRVSWSFSAVSLVTERTFWIAAKMLNVKKHGAPEHHSDATHTIMELIRIEAEYISSPPCNGLTKKAQNGPKKRRGGCVRLSRALKSNRKSLSTSLVS
jgi:hypothetical protein